jgi:hypothetical protein
MLVFLSYGDFNMFQKLLKTYMRYKMISKGNNFHTEVELDIARDQVVPKKVRFDIGFLGCVECSTYSCKLNSVV